MPQHRRRPPAVDALFESHLLVADTEASTRFYQDVVGLRLAYRMPDRDAALLWAGAEETSMIGLWSAGSAPIGMHLHIAFRVSLRDVLDAPARLRRIGVEPLSFFGDPTAEPSVIGWMPAASIYFKDPDSHLLEYIAALEGPPHPSLGIVGWQAWLERSSHAQPIDSVR
jgi:lactoylglutathione lyase